MRLTTKVANVARYVWDRTKAASQGQDFDKAPSFAAFTGMDGKNTGEIAWNNWTAQRKEYRGTAYACIRKIAPAIAAASLHLFIPEGSGDTRKFPSIKAERRGIVTDEVKVFLLTRPHCKAIMTVNEEVEELTSHPALDVFNKANGSMTRSQLFEKLGTDMTLHGNEYWHPVMNNAGTFPAMIQTIQVGTIKPIEKDGMITGYKMPRRFPVPDKKFKLDEIVHFFYPNPFSISEGYSPVSAASQRISGEVGIATVQNTTLVNNGIPPFVVKIVREMAPKKFKEFKQRFDDFTSGGNRGKGLFTQGDYSIEVLGQTLQEMGYIEGAMMLREFIANDLETPISKLTMENSNRAVAEAGNTEFMRDTILPKLTTIAEELTDSMIPLFPALEGTGAFYMFANPVPEDTRMMILQQRTDRTTGVLTANEVRAGRNIEPHPSPEAELLAPIRAPVEQQEPSEVERMAKDALDKAFDGGIDSIKNGDCGHEH